MENLSHQHRTRYVYDTRCPIHPTWIGCNIRKNSSPDHPVCSPQSLSSAALGPHAASMISCRMPPRPEKISYEKHIADTTFSYPCLHASGRNRKTAIFFSKKVMERRTLPVLPRLPLPSPRRQEPPRQGCSNSTRPPPSARGQDTTPAY